MLKYEWLSPGAHINSIKTAEVGVDVLDRCQQVVLHTQIGEPANYVVGRGQQPIMAMIRTRCWTARWPMSGRAGCLANSIGKDGRISLKS